MNFWHYDKIYGFRGNGNYVYQFSRYAHKCGLRYFGWFHWICMTTQEKYTWFNKVIDMAMYGKSNEQDKVH